MFKRLLNSALATRRLGLFCRTLWRRLHCWGPWWRERGLSGLHSSFVRHVKQKKVETCEKHPRPHEYRTIPYSLPLSMVHFFILMCFPAARNPLRWIKILRIRRHRLSCCPSSLGVGKTEKHIRRSSPLQARSHCEILQSMETPPWLSGSNILV